MSARRSSRQLVDLNQTRARSQKSKQKIVQAALLVIEDRSVLQKHPGKHNGTVRMPATY
jgi:hypothetical protein